MHIQVKELLASGEYSSILIATVKARTLLSPISEIVLLVARFGLTPGALELKAGRRELGLRRKKMIGQRLAYLRMRKILAAVVACKNPSRHCPRVVFET
jgi:hypothetical protein